MQGITSSVDPCVERQAILQSIYVHQADGRVAHPLSGTYLSCAHDLPDGAKVTSPWDSFKRYVRTSDGQPGQPEPYQLAFLRHMEPANAFLGGIGSGKTIVGAYRFKELVLLNPGALSIVGAPSNKMLWANVMKRLEGEKIAGSWSPGMIDPWMVVQPKRDYSEGRFGRPNKWGYYEIHYINGHTTYAMTLEEKSGSHLKIQGPDACGLWLDEASIMSEKVFSTFFERLRDERGMLRQCVITTSLHTKGWLEKFFLSPNTNRKLFAVTKAKTSDATFRSDAYQEEQRGVRSDREYRRKCEAEVISLEGLVYEEYLPCKEDAPCWADHQYDRRRPVNAAVDFGNRRASVVFSQEAVVNGIKGDVVFDEIALSDTSDLEVALAIKGRCYSEPDNLNGYRLHSVFTDYSNNSKIPRGTMQEVLPGVRIVPAVSRANIRYWGVPQGVNEVIKRCRDAKGVRRLWLSKALFHADKGFDVYTLRQALDNYKYPEHKTGKPIDDRPVKDGWEHACDALRYLILGIHCPGSRVEIGGGSDAPQEEGRARRWGYSAARIPAGESGGPDRA